MEPLDSQQPILVTSGLLGNQTNPPNSVTDPFIGRPNPAATGQSLPELVPGVSTGNAVPFLDDSSLQSTPFALEPDTVSPGLEPFTGLAIDQSSITAPSTALPTSILGNPEATLLQQALTSTHNTLQQFFSSSHWQATFQDAFGQTFDLNQAQAIATTLAQGDFSTLPTVEVISSDILSGARGGFDSATGQIYLSDALLKEGSSNPELVKSVLLEEIGHYFDAQINRTDTPGDEGELFADRLQGIALSDADLLKVKTEDDHATIWLNGSQHLIEESSALPNFAIRTQGTLRINNGGDLDGDPLNLQDDALVYAAKGFAINGNITLPVQYNANGTPLHDASGKLVLVPDALSVAVGYTSAQGPSGTYAGVNPPTVLSAQTVNIPLYSDLLNQTLSSWVPSGTPEVTFNAQTPLNSAADWASKFPAGGTATNPTVVHVINGGLNIPGNSVLKNLVIKVDNGSINFNGTGHTLNNVLLVVSNGGVNLSSANATNLAVFASGAINANGDAQLAGTNNLFATGTINGTINFSGNTATLSSTDQVQIIAQGNIGFNGTANLRANILSAGTVSFNNLSNVFGSIGAKGDITFNNGATVIWGLLGSANQAPTDLSLSASTVAENVPLNTVIGNLSTTDPNTNDTFTYQLVAGTGGTDNSAFNISNNQLRVSVSPDFEAKSSYSIRVRTTDQGGLSYEKALTVSVTDVNESPTNLILSNTVTPENVAAGSVIGSFTSADPDANNTFTYSLVSGSGSTDNAAFSIVGNQLKINASPNFETQPSYSIRVRTTDQGGLTYEKTLTLGITDVNEAPTSLAISNALTPENVTAGSVIGNFTSTDPDANNTFTYSLVSGTGSVDNAAFSIVGNQLKINAAPDFEAKSSYSILVRTTDQGGLSYDKAFIVGITDVNEAPTALTLSNNITPENVAAGSVIGNFTSTDPDANNTFTYSLVSGTGSTDNVAFSIVDNQLKINAAPDFEAKSSYSIRVRTIDQGGLSTEQALTIAITDVNEAPSDLSLTPSSIVENVAPGSVIGSFTSTDPDANNTFSYSLVSGTGSTDNAAFSIVGNQLNINASPNFEAQPSYSIRVRTTDQGGLSVDKALLVSILNVNEAPTAIHITNATIPENSLGGTVIGQLSTVDPDLNDVQTYTLSDSAGDRFEIIGNTLQVKAGAVLDFETNPQLTIAVKSTDAGGLSVTQQFAIAVGNVNEAPTTLALSISTLPENTPNGTVIGTLSATDPDLNDTLQYSLISGTGDTDNAAFQLVGNQLQLQTTPSFATQPNYSLRVKATDAGGLSVEHAFTIAVTDTTAPVLQAGLAHDTAPNGLTNTDGLTSDPTLQGQVTDNGTVVVLRAWFNGQTQAQAQTLQTTPNGNGQFQLNRSQLETIYGQLLNDGQYTLNLQALDAAGNASTLAVSFTLDTNAPAITGFNLAPDSDSTPVGDFKTQQSLVTLVGQSEANTQALLLNTGTTLNIDGTGQFQFTNIPLALGANPLTVQVTDAAGNQQSFTQTFTRISGNNVITDWNAIALEAIRTDRTAPPKAAYILAMMQVTVFDSVDAIDKKYDPYQIDAQAPADASPEAAAVAGAYRILSHYFPHQQAIFDTAYSQSLALIPEGVSKNEGIALGESVAEQLITLRINDGTEAVVAETPSTEVGQWRPTLPKYEGAALPQWPDVQPFALVDGAQFRPDGPPALDSARYAADYNLTKDLGAANSTSRTADQTEIAQFWTDGAGTYTPPGHWNQIAQDAAINSSNSLVDNARLFALLDVSLADAGIAAWDAKYNFNFWRPITAIQQGNLDSNPLTTADPTWTPLLSTPPFAEYVSGHSTFSGAASTILTSAFGSNYSFTTTSYGLTGITRSFTSFDQAAQEAGMSRIYGGIHFNSANLDGLALGQNVGNYVASNYFQPINRSTVLQANLANDTAPVGTTNRDKVTSDPTITGTVTGAGLLVKAGLDQTTAANYQNISAFVSADGSFTLNTAALSQLKGSTLQDGVHTVHFQVFDAQGTLLDTQDLAFVLDRGAPSVSFEAPTTNAIYSPTAHLKGQILDSLSQGGTVRYSIDGLSFQQFKADASGQFDQIISAAGLGVGIHQLTVELYDAAGNKTQSNIAFTVSNQFSEGGALTNGWGAQSADALTLYEGNSFEVQKVTPVEVGVAAGTRTLEFDINPNWDLKDAAAVAQDRLLVYLVDPANPSHTLLDAGANGTALFSLSGTQAEYRPGLVRFDGQHVSIDLSSLTEGTTGNLVFQLLSLDGDTGSSVQIRNLSNTVDPTGTPSPIFPGINPSAIAGPAVALDSYLSNPNAKVLLSNVHLDSTTGQVLADLKVQNTGASTISSNMVVLFPNLPSGVSLLNTSGTHPAGSSYLNLKPAFTNGDLKAGATSGTLQVVLADPNLTQFELQTVVLTGALTQPPQLPNLGTLNVTAGARLEVPLTATSPDGALVTLSLRDANNLPTGKLENGKLTFTPSPADIGTYHFTLVATSNGLETTQPVTLNVAADPVTTTRVSGVVQNTDQMPLSGILVDVDGWQAVTDAQGHFTVELPGTPPTNTLRVLGGLSTGSDYPSIAEKLPLLLEHDVYAGVNNDIARPIYLPKLDYGNGQIVDSTHDALVTTAKIPGASVMVAAGTITDQNGNPFTGVMSITEVPTNLTPAALPENLHPDLVVTIQPGDMKFNTPAPLSLPNRAGYAPGQIMDLWSINPTTGNFDNVGKGEVSADGSVINTIEGGIRNSSWHFFAPLEILSNLLSNLFNPEQGCSTCKATSIPTNSNVELQSGAVEETQNLVSYQSLGITNGLSLHYNSLRADPRPIVHFGFPDINPYTFTNAPERVKLVAKLSFQNGNFSYQVPGAVGGQFGLTGGENVWSVPASNSGSVDAALQGDLSALPTGQYEYTLVSGINIFVSDQFVGTSTVTKAKVISVNSIDSAFGSGWELSGLQQLYKNDDQSILLVDGNGTELLFQAPTIAGNPFVSPPGNFSTLEQLSDGTFRLTEKDHTVSTFNSDNKLAQVEDSNHNVTRYNYDATGKLTQIVDPVGLTTSLTYTGNYVTSITDPAGKVTQMQYDAAGNLIGMTNPDGSQNIWEYDDKHHLTASTDPLGNRAEDFYDFAGRGTGAVRKDGTVVNIQPVEVQGLYRPEQTSNVQSFYHPELYNNPITAPLTFQLGSPIASQIDGNGNISLLQIDKAGQLVNSKDGVGNQPSVTRNGQNLISTVTDARGNVTTFTYDANGNVIQSQDTVFSSTPPAYTFADPVYPVGGNPQGFTLGDLNGDGYLDLVTANFSGSSISVLLGKADGTFGLRTDLSTGYTPKSVKIADLNQDGKADIITANQYDNSFSILFGNGDGIFSSHTEIAVGNSPDGLEVADLNHDGKLDLITSNSASNSITTLFGNGDGTFAGSNNIEIGVSPSSFALGDVNQDGNVDLVTSNSSSSSISVFLGNSNGTFGSKASYSLSSSPSIVKLADIDENGTLDIISVNTFNYYGSNVSVLTGNGDGSFKSPVISSTGVIRDISVGDFNGDNIPDFAAVTSTYSYSLAKTIELYTGDSKGNFKFKTLYNTPNTSDYIALADLDRDHNLDVITLGSSTNSASVLLGNGNGTLEAIQSSNYSVGRNPISLTLSDINEDGILDAITANNNSNTLSLSLGRPDGSFASPSSLLVSYYPNFVASRDLNGDHHQDLVVANRANNSISVFLGNGNGTFAPRIDYSVGNSPTSIAIDDLNGDGFLDLLVANSGDLQATILLGTGDGTFKKQSADLKVGASPNTVVSEDLNGDGIYDIVTANSIDGTLSVLLGKADGNFESHYDIYVGNDPTSLALQDVNNDGNIDAIVTHDTNQVSVLLGQGDGAFSASTSYIVGNGASGLTLSDVNSDGITDVLTASQYDGSISILLGQGDGSFGTVETILVGGSPISVSSADLDGDGKIDLSVLNSYDASFNLFWGNGDGTFTAQVPTYDILRSQNSALGDVNGDGFLDLIATSADDNKATLLLGNSDGTFNPEIHEYEVGTNSTDVALIDLNGDGKLDLVTINPGVQPSAAYAANLYGFSAAALVGNGYGSGDTTTSSTLIENKVSVRLGNGDGTFQPLTSYIIGTQANSTSTYDLKLSFADVNGDGKLDILTPYTDFNYVSLLIGNGDGTFGNSITVTTGDGPVAINQGDVNGDGKLDIVSANSINNTVSVLLGNGDGTYAQSVDLSLGTDTFIELTSVHLADLNRDGKLDIVSTKIVTFGEYYDNTGSISIQFGNGDGTFESTIDLSVGLAPGLLQTDDLNGDGILDIILADPYSNQVSVLLGQGDGTFGSEITTTGISYSKSVNLADLNGDGKLDLITTDQYSNQAHVYFGKGNGSFTVNPLVNAYPFTFTLGDLNQDGKLDIISGGDFNVSIALNQGNRTFTTLPRYAVEGWAQSITIGDINGDQKLDVVTSNIFSNSVSAFLGVGDGTVEAPKNFATGYTPVSVVLKDLNRDGHLDIVTANENDNSVSILKGVGDGTFIDQSTTNDSPSSIIVGDLNRDGITDLVSVSPYSSYVEVLLGRGNATFYRGTNAYFNVNAIPSFVTLADVNQDGILDLLTANGNSNNVSLLLGNGDGTFETATTFDVGQTPVSIAVGDVNDDGYVDLITTNQRNNTVSILLGYGDGTFADAQAYRVESGPTAIALGDLNNDGELDFVTANAYSNSLSPRLNLSLANTRTIAVSKSFTYDPLFNKLTSATDELGHQTLYEIDPLTGNTLSMTRVVGDVGGSDDLIAHYSYTSQGLLDLITDPLGHLTDYDYDAQGRLVQITTAKGSSDEAIQRFEYDASGNRTAFIDENGNRTTYAYDALNRLVQVTEADPDGAGPLTSPITSFGYDASGNQTAVTNSRGFTTQFAYDALNRPTLATDALNGVVQYQYDNAGNIISMTDELGHRTQYKYDSRNRRIESIDPEGGRTQYLYDVNNNQIAQIDALGRRTDFVYDPRNRLIREKNPLGGVTTYTYDAVGNLIAQTDEKRQKTQFTYDDLNRLIQTTDALGNTETYTYDKDSNLIAKTDALGHTTTYTYDNRNRLTAIVDPLNGRKSMTYDGVGNLLTYTDELNHTTIYRYDALNRQISTTDALGNTTSFTYDSEGNRVAVTDALSHTSSYSYDALNRTVSMTDALGNSRTMAYDAASNLIAQTDELNRTTTYTYDSRNLLTAVTDPLNHTTTSAYDAVGNLIGVTDALGRTTTYFYDALNRNIGITDALGGNATFTYDAASNLIAQTDQLNRTTTYTYDSINRLTAITDPLNHTSTTTYDAVGNVIASADALHNTTTYSYDALDRRVSTTDALGQSTLFIYDSIGNLLSINDPDLNKTTYTYDALNREISDTNQLGLSRTFAYDAVGNEISSIDRDGRTTSYVYDALNRQTQELWLDATNTPIHTITRTYDAASELTAISDGDSRYSYSYDNAGRLITVDNSGTPGVPSVQLSYGYDAVNNRTSVTDNINGQAAGVTAYTFDALDRNTEITQSGTGVSNKRVDMSYDAASQMTGIARYADLLGLQAVATTSYSYDLAGKLTRLTNRSSSTVYADYQWTYDAADRITQFVSPDGTSNYNYDSRGQLTGANNTNQPNEAYSYDANGNRTNSGYQTGTNNQLLSDGTYNYTYDNEGNRTSRTNIAIGEVTLYFWDYHNRLTSVVTQNSSGTVTESVAYTYDAYDRRIAKVIDPDGAGPATATTERMVYDGSNIALTFDGTGAQTHRYLYGPGVDQILADETATSVNWVLVDNQGSVRDVIDSNGNVLNHIVYDSYGQVTSETNAGFDFRFGYTGRERDRETGLQYNRARYYDPRTGGFIGQDPIGFAGGDANLYRYVANSPLNLIDPYGTSWLNDADAALSEHGIDLYRSVNTLDQGIGGFGSGATGGFTDLARQAIYGGGVNNNQQGLLHDASSVVGDVASSVVGGAAEKGGSLLLRGGAGLLKNASKAADLYGKAESAGRLLQGCGDLGDVANLASGLGNNESQGDRNGNHGISPVNRIAPSGHSPLLPGEGKVGTYKDLKRAGSKGDNITPHHIPSDRHMEQHGVKRNDGISINMEQPPQGGRHRETLTYGTTADASMSPRDALAAGVRDARAIYQKAGLYNGQLRQSLQDVIKMNKTNNPNLFNK